MNKKWIFWGGMTAAMVLILNIIFHLLNGARTFGAGPYGHGGPGHMGPRGDFGPHHMMGHHHGGAFSWIWFLVFLIIGIAILVLLAKSLRKKSQAASMQQFIDTSIMSQHRSVTNQNASFLDQWEKTITSKKEQE